MRLRKIGESSTRDVVIDTTAARRVYLGELEERGEYAVSVAAYSMAGLGPASPERTVRTGYGKFGLPIFVYLKYILQPYLLVIGEGLCQNRSK